MMSKLARLIPAARWLGGYEQRFIWRDLTGGLAVGGMLQKLGEEDILATVGEAIRAYVERTGAGLGRDMDWQRADEPPRPSGGPP